MNSIDVRAQFESESNDLYIELAIDDQLLVNPKHDHLAIDLAELVKTLEDDGEFFIITCTCGDPGCAGIMEGVKVHHNGKMVYWQFRIPQVDLENVRTAAFMQDNYVRAIQDSLAQFIELYKLHQGAEIVPYLLRERIMLPGVD